RRRPAVRRRGHPGGDRGGRRQAGVGGQAARSRAVSAAAPALRTSGLTKRFRGGQLAVAELDLQVPSGSVFGFLGPSGSGTPTAIRMRLGLLMPTRGPWEVLGTPMPAGASSVLRRVGSLIEGPAFHPYLSGWANLERLDAADSLANPRTTRRRIGAA